MMTNFISARALERPFLTQGQRTWMFRAILFFLALGALLLLPYGEAQAQAPVAISVEGRAGVTIPTGDLSNRGAEVGLTFGTELHAQFHPSFSVYAGVHRHAFQCDQGCTLGSNPRSTGVGAGVKFVVHDPGDVRWWARGGVVSNRLSTDNGSNDRDLGFAVGVGADLPFGPRVALVPNAGYISHGSENNFSTDFFTFGVGVRYRIQ